MITIYTTGTNCHRCEQLHKWLVASGKTYMIADMTSAQILAELRTEGQFSLEAPILRKQAPGKDDWYSPSDLFKGDMLDGSKLVSILGEQHFNESVYDAIQEPQTIPQLCKALNADEYKIMRALAELEHDGRAVLEGFNRFYESDGCAGYLAKYGRRR